jgi:hypothetical protein
MARWTLKCDNRNSEFTHSMITDLGAESYYLPETPDLGEGVELECPHCGNKDTYDRSNLMYRA